MLRHPNNCRIKAEFDWKTRGPAHWMPVLCEQRTTSAGGGGDGTAKDRQRAM